MTANIIMNAKIQNQAPLTVVKTLSGFSVKTTTPAENKIKVTMLEAKIAVFFLYRSIIEPNQLAEKIERISQRLATIDVEMTEFVVKYAQKVKANHTKLLVVTATRVTAKSL